MERKGQSASNSAILVIIITALIILYILFLPPAERYELLSDGTTSGGDSTSNPGYHQTNFQEQVLHEQVGRLEALSRQEQEHTLPSFIISTLTEGSVIKEVHSLNVRTSVFETKMENVSFHINSKATKNTQLSFNTGAVADGRLIILLNGRVIFDKDITPQSSNVVGLPTEALGANNLLTFTVSTPGWAFWRVHEYDVESLRIVGDYTNKEQSTTDEVFYITDEEEANLNRAVLRYYADCETSDVGIMTVRVNRETVFSGVGDCGVQSTIELDKQLLSAGDNEIRFSTEKGTYLIDNILVKTYLDEPISPIYYFELDEDLFNIKNTQPVCGEIDNYCPSGCSEDMDKDCCFEDTTSNYWCDLETAQLQDRCVSFVTDATAERCISGYEDEDGDPATASEDLCGDDTDDICPSGCSQYLDKDCCFSVDNTYWCDDVPLGKPLSSVCKLGVEPDECNSCPDLYRKEGGGILRCSSTSNDDEDGERLVSEYKVIMTLHFPNTLLKRGSIMINGREIGLETSDTEMIRDISSYVRSLTNSIEIIPDKSMDVTSITVDVKKR